MKEIKFFYAEWEDLSKKMLKNIEKIKEEFPNLNIKIVDIDQQDGDADKISIIPSLMIIGDEIQIIEGFQLIKPLRTLFRSLQK